MTDKKAGKHEFSAFFREEAASAILGQEGHLPEKDEKTGTGLRRPERPVLPEAGTADEEAQKTFWRTLRGFFRSGEGGGIPRGENGPGLVPAILSPFQGKPYLPTGFPFWLGPMETAGGDVLLPLDLLLQQAVLAFAPEEKEARALKDNLLRLTGIIRHKLEGVDDSFSAVPVWEESLQDMERQLALKGAEGEALSKDIAQLRQHLPSSGFLLPCTLNAPLLLLAFLLDRQGEVLRKSFRRSAQPLIKKLKDILEVERENSPQARSPEHLHEGLDFADEFLNFDALSAVLPEGGINPMPAERLQRLSRVLATLEGAENLLFSRAATLIAGRELHAHLPSGLERIFGNTSLKKSPGGQSIAAAIDAFDQQMKEAAGIMAALRIAGLETGNDYVAEVHDGFFEHFDWQNFTAEEMGLCPPVLLIEDAGILLRDELQAFSGLLASNRPICCLAIRFGDKDMLSGTPLFRPELAAMAIAHRNTYILQNAGIDLEYLYQGFRKGLTVFSPALFHLLLPENGGKGYGDPYLWMSAAVEGREFPGFIYDHQQGPRWGSRFDMGNNPQPAADWPLHELPVTDASGREASLSLSFTFADFAAQDPRYAAMFFPVPPPFWQDDLIPLSDYLPLSPAEGYAKVPFIWMVDDEKNLHKTAVAWPVVVSCRERMDFWHFLQENAGIHSFHVERATEKLHRDLEAAHAGQIDTLKAAHEEALEKAREETARTAMEQLAAMLLDLEPMTAVIPAPQAKAPVPENRDKPAPVPAPAPEAPATTEPPAGAEEKMPPGEAWIETPLCTSCNECKDINPRIFQYNAEKQAYVADPRGGPFADIVQAAEKCPVGIIHPGAPQDPDEPGLEELVRRAERFN